LSTVALPEINARQSKSAATNPPVTENGSESASGTLGNSVLDQAREILQSLQDEEQIILNQRMVEQEWASQSTEILDFLPKLERAVLEMEKEKGGYLLTGQTSFVDAYRRAVTDFYTYNGYLSILVANTPKQAELLANIRASVERWINSSATPAIEAKRAGKDVTHLVAVDNGETLMADIRQMLAGFEKNEVNAYEMRTAAATRERIIKTSVLGVLALFAVSLLVISNSYSFVLVRQHLSKLKGAETHIRSIIDNILDAMITVDANGMICSINPAAEKMFGYSGSELVGHKLSKLVPKWYANQADANPVAWAWEQIAKQTGNTILALGRTRKLVSFSTEMSLSEMEVNQQKLYVAMVRDVTERQRFEKDLAAEKESLAVTLRSIGDGVITTDLQGKIIMINSEGERLTGWPSREAIGQPLKSVFNITIDVAAQARTQKSGYRNEAQSILVSLPESATLTSRDGTEYIVEQ